MAEPPWDFLAIFNVAEVTDAELSRAVVFQCETPAIRASWAHFYKRCAKAFYFFDIAHHHCADKWYVDMPWDSVASSPVKYNLLSGCVSGKNYLPLHGQRIRAVNKLGTLPLYHHYGRGGWGKLASYRGAPSEKSKALDPYCFHFNCENDRERNYFTEKVTDAFLRECVLLYDGCPNLEDFFPAESFIRVDVDDLDGVLATASRVNTPSAAQRSAVLEAKRRVMYEYNPLAILDRILA